MKSRYAILLALFVILMPCVARAQEGPDVGTWSLRSGDRGDDYFEIRVAGTHGDSEYGRDEPASHFAGLSANDLASAGASVAFDLIRDAGTLRCIGHVAAGRGGGTFRFAANPAYAHELAALSVDTPSADEQRSMALADVSLAFVRTLHDARYTVRSPHDLIRLVEHGVRVDLIAGLARDGYRLAAPDDLVRFADHGVSLTYVEDFRALGFRPPADRFVAMVDHGVTVDFARELTNLGYRPSVDQLIALTDHGVTAAFARKMATQARKPDIDDLIRLRDAGI